MAFIIMIYRYLQVGPYGAMRRAALALNHLRAVKIKQNCPVKVRETIARLKLCQKAARPAKKPPVAPCEKGDGRNKYTKYRKIHERMFHKIETNFHKNQLCTAVGNRLTRREH